MSKKTIVHIGTLYAKLEYTDALIKSFEGLKQAPGYIYHTCFKDIKDKNKLTLVEKWENKKTMKVLSMLFQKKIWSNG